MNKCIQNARKAWRRNAHRPASWWWETYGVFPDDLPLIQDSPSKPGVVVCESPDAPDAA